MESWEKVLLIGCLATFVLGLVVVAPGLYRRYRPEEVKAGYIDLSSSTFSGGVFSVEGEAVDLAYGMLQNFIVYEVIHPLADPLVLEECIRPSEARFTREPQFFRGGWIWYKGEVRETPEGRPAYLFRAEATGALERLPVTWGRELDQFCCREVQGRICCSWEKSAICHGEMHIQPFKVEIPEVWITAFYTEPREEWPRMEDYLQVKVVFGDAEPKVTFEDATTMPVEAPCPSQG